MFWIIGGDYLTHALADTTSNPILQWLSAEMNHSEWVGVHFYDLIFPLFMFLSGVSASIVLSRADKSKAPVNHITHAGRRVLILILLGIVYNFGWDITVDRFRIPSVLGLIGVSFFIAVIILVKIKSWRGRAIALAAIWALVALLQLGVPVPHAGAGVLTPDGSINGWIDRTFLPGRLYGGSYDPEGLLGIISGSTITLAGAFAGAILLGTSRSYFKKALIIAGLGTLVLLTGLAMTPYYPPIKKLWTVSFDLIAIGACSVLLAVFVMLIEEIQLRRWSFFFAVIGSNSIAIYMFARFFAYPLLGPLSDFNGSIALKLSGIVAIIAVEWGLLYWMYHKQIFMKV